MRYFFGVLCLVFFLNANVLAASNEEAARVKNCSGAAFIVRQNQTLPAKKYDRIFAGDVLRTGRDGTLGVIFKDDTTLSLGPRSELVIDEFLFAPSQGKLSIVTRMLRGDRRVCVGCHRKNFPPRPYVLKRPRQPSGFAGPSFWLKSKEKKQNESCGDNDNLLGRVALSGVLRGPGD